MLVDFFLFKITDILKSLTSFKVGLFKEKGFLKSKNEKDLVIMTTHNLGINFYLLIVFCLAFSTKSFKIAPKVISCFGCITLR